MWMCSARRIVSSCVCSAPGCGCASTEKLRGEEVRSPGARSALTGGSEVKSSPSTHSSSGEEEEGEEGEAPSGVCVLRVRDGVL